jgi:hypothetical protein
MDDVENVEKIGQENSSFRLSTPPSDTPRVTQKSRWRANGTFVAMSVFNDANDPSECAARARKYELARVAGLAKGLQVYRT